MAAKKAKKPATGGTIMGEDVPAPVALKFLADIGLVRVKRSGVECTPGVERDVLPWMNEFDLSDRVTAAVAWVKAEERFTVRQILSFNEYLHSGGASKRLKYPANVCAAISAAWRELAARCYMLIGAWAAIRNQLRGGFHVVQGEAESPYDMKLGELKNAVPKEVRDALFGPGPDAPDKFSFSAERRAVAIEIIEAVRSGKCKTINDARASVYTGAPHNGLSTEMRSAYSDMAGDDGTMLKRWARANKLKYTLKKLTRLKQAEWEAIKAHLK